MTLYVTISSYFDDSFRVIATQTLFSVHTRDGGKLDLVLARMREIFARCIEAKAAMTVLVHLSSWPVGFLNVLLVIVVSNCLCEGVCLVEYIPPYIESLAYGVIFVPTFRSR